MEVVFLAKLLLSAVAATQGIASCAIDLNRTHATNPHWPGHARFHLVWQRFTSLLAAAVEVSLVWWAGPEMRLRFYLAAILTGIPMLGFVFAVVARPLYNGTLHDPNGIQPLRLPLPGRVRELDGNAMAVAGGLAALAVSVLLFRSGH